MPMLTYEDQVLRSWSELNEELMEASEEMCLSLLETEKAGKRRVAFLIRIYGRYNKLRTNRERTELVGGIS